MSAGPLVVELVCRHCRRILAATDGTAIRLDSGATINHRVTVRCVCGVERTFYPAKRKEQQTT